MTTVVDSSICPRMRATQADLLDACPHLTAEDILAALARQPRWPQDGQASQPKPSSNAPASTGTGTDALIFVTGHK